MKNYIKYYKIPWTLWSIKLQNIQLIGFKFCCLKTPPTCHLSTIFHHTICSVWLTPFWDEPCQVPFPKPMQVPFPKPVHGKRQCMVPFPNWSTQAFSKAMLLLPSTPFACTASLSTAGLLPLSVHPFPKMSKFHRWPGYSLGASLQTLLQWALAFHLPVLSQPNRPLVASWPVSF